MKCFKHQDKDAVGMCAVCRQGICAECSHRRPQASNALFCEEHALSVVRQYKAIYIALVVIVLAIIGMVVYLYVLN